MFPGGHQPDYSDFFYFSFIIGVACQTADVTSRPPGARVALFPGLLHPPGNTANLAATIIIAAGLG